MWSNLVCNHTRDNRTSAMQSSEFVDHSYDYRPNWTLASPVTIIDDNNTQEFRITVMFRILQTVSIAISNCDNEIIVNSGNMEC